MDHDLICSWLGLPPGSWPPDHYRLLGLNPGESNAELIEQCVHERLDTVRRYQMMHPEQATEAMNRLAQAFVCLSESPTKSTYDAELGIAAPAAPATTDTAIPPALPLPVESKEHTERPDWLAGAQPLAWHPEKSTTVSGSRETLPQAIPIVPPPLPSALVNEDATPPPMRLPPPLPPVARVAQEAIPSVVVAAVAAAIPPPAALPLEPIDPVLEAAQSGPARRGIATRRALYQRVARTRRLLRLWNDLGKYLSSPKRRLSRTNDGPDLIRLLEESATLLKRFPALLGEAGQPGYLVLALTQVDTVKVFQSFSPQQREALSRDWRAGVTLLTAHRDFLRRELRAMRKRPLGQRLLRTSWSLLIEQPGAVLLLLALLAVNIALWRTYAETLWEKLISP